MRRICLPMLLLAGTTFACGRQPCESGENGGGPTVRLDVAIHTCNSTPIARITGPTSVEKNARVMLDASESSDSNGDALDYRWELIVPAGSNAKLESTSGEATSLQIDRQGVYEVVLYADDGELTSEPARLTINASNHAPVADTGADFVLPVGANAALDASNSSDPDGDALSYEWTFVEQPAGSTAVIDAPNSARASFIADVAGIFVLSLRVGDGELFGESRLRVGAGFGGGAPNANAGMDATVDAAIPIVLDGSRSSDPDGDPLTYEWRIVDQPPNGGGLLRDTTTSRASFTATGPGRFLIELAVSDGFFGDSDTVEISVTLPPVGQVNVGHCSTGGNVIVLDGDEDEDLLDNNPEPHDWVHPGRETLSASEGMITGVAAYLYNTTVLGYAEVSFRNASRDFDLEFAIPPDGVDPLAPGTYEDAQRLPFRDPGHPGLEVTGDGRGCNTIAGTFRIHEIATSTTGDFLMPIRLDRLTATFSQYCEAGEAELRGCVHFER